MHQVGKGNQQAPNGEHLDDVPGDAADAESGDAAMVVPGVEDAAEEAEERDGELIHLLHGNGHQKLQRNQNEDSNQNLLGPVDDDPRWTHVPQQADNDQRPVKRVGGAEAALLLGVVDVGEELAVEVVGSREGEKEDEGTEDHHLRGEDSVVATEVLATVVPGDGVTSILAVHIWDTFTGRISFHLKNKQIHKNVVDTNEYKCNKRDGHTVWEDSK